MGKEEGGRKKLRNRGGRKETRRFSEKKRDGGKWGKKGGKRKWLVRVRRVHSPGYRAPRHLFPLLFAPFLRSLAAENVIYFSERGRTHSPTREWEGRAAARRCLLRTRPLFKYPANGRRATERKTSTKRATLDLPRMLLDILDLVNLCNLATDEINNLAAVATLRDENAAVCRPREMASPSAI